MRPLRPSDIRVDVDIVEKRKDAISNLIAHDNEDYGVITQYLRMKGIVPPSTANTAKARGETPR